MRLFFAVDMPRLPLWDPETGAGSQSPAAAPVHLTLRFLGERSTSLLPELERAGELTVAGMSEFPVVLDRIGAFPSPRSPRIVWLGVSTGSGELVALERRLSEALAPLGIPVETREFVPHVTWRRVRSRHDAERARRWLEVSALPTPLQGRVTSLVLKESELTATGARHRVVADFPLVPVPSPQDGSRPTRS